MTHPSNDSTRPFIPPEYVEHLLDRIQDYALCSDLRMHAWTVRRQSERDGRDADEITYNRETEGFTSASAEQALNELRYFVSELASGNRPDLPESDVNQQSDFVTEIKISWDRQVADLNLPADLLSTSGAAGLVVSSWRNTIEPWHCLFTDAEMSWMSMISTRDITECMDPETNSVETARAAEILCNGERDVLPDTTAADAFGPAWPQISNRIASNIQEHNDTLDTVRYLAAWAAQVCTDWWGCFQWQTIVLESSDQLRLTRYRRQQIRREPWKLPFEIWERHIELRKGRSLISVAGCTHVSITVRLLQSGLNDGPGS